MMKRAPNTDLLLHLARVVGASVALVWFRDNVWGALIAAAALHFACFSFLHEVEHSALGLPRRLTEWLLAVVGVPMFVSGHSMRLVHARHHARPMASDDVEGAGAATSFWGSVMMGPRNAAQHRLLGVTLANARERRWIAAETLALLAVTAFALGSGSIVGAAWVVSNLALVLTASAWASHLPHHPPRWLLRAGRALFWTGSLLAIGFVLHLEHHAHPKLTHRALMKAA